MTLNCHKRELQVHTCHTFVDILLCCTTYKILYMCRILVPAVRFGAYFKMCTPCCCSVWSTSHKRCLKANVARFCENVAWISLDEFWMPSWVDQVLNGLQMCIKIHISQWTLGYSICCGEGWVWKTISWSFRSASYRIPYTTCVKLGSKYRT